MKKLILISCLLATAIAANAQQTNKNSRCDSYLNAFVSSTRIAGLAVAVVENGAVSFMKSYGARSL